MSGAELALEGAVFSPDRTFRYALRRSTGQLGGAGTVAFVCLNPSTADEETNDPTVRRCLGYARRWDYAELLVANLFGIRSTDPRGLYREGVDPVGPENDLWIARCAEEADLVVAAWGMHGSHRGRSAAVLAYLGRCFCLGRTQTDEPRHPLYLPATAQLEVLQP